jgi:hypothetical protein
LIGIPAFFSRRAGKSLCYATACALPTKKVRMTRTLGVQAEPPESSLRPGKRR